MTLVAQKMFSDVLKDALQRAEMSTRDLADRSDTSQSTISKCLNGASPPLYALDIWARLLGLEGQDFDEFVELGRQAKAHNNRANSQYFSALESRIAKMEKEAADREKLLLQLAQIVLQSGGKLGQKATLIAEAIVQRLQPRP